MTLESWFALVLALLILGLSPGPGWAAVVSTSMTRGFRSAFALAVGIAIGDLIFVLLAVYGLGTMANLMGNFFVIVKYVGAAYLIYLGVSLWRDQARLAPQAVDSQSSGPGSFLAGLAITMGNPKVIAFYLGFLPAFMDLDAITTVDLLVLVTTVFVVICAVLSGYAVIALQSRVWLQSKSTRGLVGKLGGLTMIATGVAVAVRN